MNNYLENNNTNTWTCITFGTRDIPIDTIEDLKDKFQSKEAMTINRTDGNFFDIKEILSKNGLDVDNEKFISDFNINHLIAVTWDTVGPEGTAMYQQDGSITIVDRMTSKITIYANYLN